MWSDPSDFSDGQPVGAYLLNRFLRDDLKHLYWDCFPQSALLWHEDSLVLTGNAIDVTPDSSAYNCYLAAQNAAANGDSWTQSMVLAPGTYQIAFACKRGTQSGILDLYLNNAWFGQLDFYVSPSVHDPSYGGLTFTTDGGRVTLKGVINGKNAASGNYFLSLSAMYIKPVDTSNL